MITNELGAELGVIYNFVIFMIKGISAVLRGVFGPRRKGKDTSNVYADCA